MVVQRVSIIQSISRSISQSRVSKWVFALTLGLSACIFSYPAQANSQSSADTSTVELSPELALSKIRNRLLGDWPTIEEWDALHAAMSVRSCQKVSCLHDYFAQRIAEYMKNPRYVARMSLKVEELLYLRSGSFPWDQYAESGQSPKPPQTPVNYERNNLETFNALSSLIRRVFTENLPWDELYTAKTYEIYPTVPGQFTRSESAFYNLDTPSLPPTQSDPAALPSPLKVDVSTNPNASGVFSTPRFLNRFWNSSLNQGRKRSAAIFRVLVCDTLFPSLERKSQAADEVSKALGSTEKAIADAHTSQVVNKHSSDPACIRCHQRLDPLAWTLRGLEVGFSARPYPGYVRFYDTSGQLTKFKVTSFDEAIATFTKQQKYRSCQVDHLFRWVIGKDVDVTPARLAQLESDFDKVGRKTNDYVSHLLLSKEFLTKPQQAAAPPSVPASLYERATVVFSNCIACHGSSYPFTDLKQWNKKRLADIVWKLDLANDGVNREMPPRDYKKWQPSASEIQDVKSWIAAGSPSSDGTNALTPDEALKILEKK